MRTFSVAVLSSLSLLVVPASAGAQEAACCQLTTSVSQDVIRGQDVEADERFFATEGAPPNIHFLIDNSGSMNELAVHAALDRELDDREGLAVRCANNTLNDLLLATGWNPDPAVRATDAKYAYQDTGTGEGSDTGFPNLFVRNKYYRYQTWWDTSDKSKQDSPPAMSRANAGEVCNGYFGYSTLGLEYAACTACLNTKGYYIDPNIDFEDPKYEDDVIFTGEFLNLNPPKYVTLRIVLKNVIKNLRRMRAGYSIFNDSDGGDLVQGQNPSCKQIIKDGSSFDSNRASYINDINSIHFKTSTPLAEALFNVGQYFSSSNSIYTTKYGFDSSYLKTDFKNGSLNSETRSVCWGCQDSNVVILTDGEPTNDSSLPVSRLEKINGLKTPRLGCSTTSGDCKVVCPDEDSNGTPDCGNGDHQKLDDVAKFLHENDLQESTPATIGDLNTASDQTLNIYAVAFGLSSPLLKNTTVVGGNSDGDWYYEADDRASLELALLSIIGNIETRATSFSAASVASFQINRSGGSLLPRFKPSATLNAPREGFLYRFEVGSEEVLGCDPVKAATLLTDPPGAGDPNDLNRDGTCNDVNLIDANGKAVIEDSEGGFVLANAPTTPAVPFWEAGAVLKARGAPAWTTRKIWTVVDDSGDGKIDASDTPFEFTAANAAKLLPYLGITQDPAFCADLATKMGSALTPVQCAEVVIRWYRGANQLSTDPLKRLQDRRFLLHDIFHSAPVSIDPPLDRRYCGLTNQCTEALYGTDTPLAEYGTAPVKDAYDTYVDDRGKRSKVAVVGSNGGMLHAFHNGNFLGTDPDTGLPLHDAGTGKELWAFVPPDMLPKMANALGKHGYFVDSSPMVREVWVDSNSDGKKQRDEYRTVAVTGSGTGGVHRFALDLTRLLGTTNTNVGEDFAQGDFLWMWPQPCDQEALLVGEATTNFSPKPPPIGPVAIRDDSSGPLNIDGVKAKEQWIVFMNGGYDKYLNRGRMLAMLDIRTGKSIWTMSFNDGSPNSSKAMFPFAAGVGMLDIGQGVTSSLDFDLLFDTATVGDYGGQVWTVRFWSPGEIDATTGKVGNWFAARSFQATPTGKDLADQVNATTANSGQYKEPFSQVTSNTIDPKDGTLHTYLGSGDRNNLTDTGGPTCRLSNLRGCIAQGCNVGPVTMTTTRSGTTAATLANDPVAFAYGTSSQTTAAANSCTSGFSTTLSWKVASGGSCTTNMLTDAGGAVPQIRVSCNGTTCTREDDWAKLKGVMATAPENTARFYGFLSYGRDRIFNTSAAAGTYDDGRLDDVDLVDITDTTSTGAGVVSGNVATSADKGWRLRLPLGDERTGSATAIVDGCVLFNTFQPGDTVGAICPGTGTNNARFYQADFITGAPNCAFSFIDPTTGSYRRSIHRTVVAVPGDPAPQLMLSGGYAATGVITLEAGNTQGNRVSEEKELIQSMYQLPIDAEEHACRHEANGCK